MSQGVKIKATVKGSELRFTAYHGKKSVGFLTAVLHPDGRVWCKLLKVKDAVHLHNGSLVKGLRKLFGKRLERWEYFRPQNFRKKGVSRDLLVSFLAWCRENKIHEIAACITPAGLEAQPRLVEWYRMHGFRAQEPDERCLPQSVKMVVMKLPSA